MRRTDTIAVPDIPWCLDCKLVDCVCCPFCVQRGYESYDENPTPCGVEILACPRCAGTGVRPAGACVRCCADLPGGELCAAEWIDPSMPCLHGDG